MNARIEVERRKSMRICERAKKLFPRWSHAMRQRWINAKFYLGLTDPKVKIGCDAPAGSTWRSAITV